MNILHRTPAPHSIAPYAAPKRAQDVALDFRRGEIAWHMSLTHVRRAFTRRGFDCPMSGDALPAELRSRTSPVEATNE